MSLSEPLVLATDVLFIPLADLDPDTRARVSGDDTDVAVSRPSGRAPSVVVDPGVAALLDRFREPSTLVHAVVRFAKDRALDAEELLEGAYPLVKRFLASRVLRPAGEVEQDMAAAGDVIPLAGSEATVEVLRVVARMDDTEVLQVRLPDGTVAALKRPRPGAAPAAGMVSTLSHEGEMLQHLSALGCAVSPLCLRYAAPGGNPELLIEWCPGVELPFAAAELRARGDRAGLAALATRLGRAYAELHAAGVAHGDVHPRNVLVDALGAVRLIDFGLARRLDGPVTGPLRGGVGFYFEPEFARAGLAQAAPPPATPASDQYAVGVLIYELITGYPYLDFQLGRDEMLRQIAEADPVALSDRGLDPWPELEQVLGRALAKHPTERWSSCRAFAAALSAVAALANESAAESPPPPAHTEQGPGLTRLIEAELDRTAAPAPATQEELPAPTASLKYGAAGVCFALLRIASARGDVDALAAAELWLARAYREAATPEGFLNAAHDLTPAVLGEASPLHNLSGLAAVEARLARALGQPRRVEAAVHRFVELSARPAEGLDLTLGRGATVLGAALLLDLCPPGNTREVLIALGRAGLAEIWTFLDAEPGIALSGISNLGAAHGWAGHLYVALQWFRASGDPLPAGFVRRAEELGALAIPAGRGLRWPWERPNPAGTMPGWCNGSAGQALVWSLAHRLLGTPRYRELALGAAWDTYDSPDLTASLCCGLTGRAYALLAVWKATGDETWLRRARELAQRAAQHGRFEAEYPRSLYKGELGLAVLAADLEAPAQAAFPWFEEEGWAG